MNAREWIEYCSPSEWDNETMRQIARDRFLADPTLDIVRVYEHGGWMLAWNRDEVIVATANDTAQLKLAAYEWASRFTGTVVVGTTHRRDSGDHEHCKYQSYYPVLSSVA